MPVRRGAVRPVSDTHRDVYKRQVVTILWRLDGSPAWTTTSGFSDVEESAYYAEAVGWASANGIVGGYDNETFGPGDPITREQMAAILYRFAQTRGWDTTAWADLSGYAAAGEIRAYALPALQWANGAGLIAGRGGAILPGDSATRAQVAAILMRLCETFAV